MIPKPSHPIVDGKPIDRYWYDALSRIAASSLSRADVKAVVDGAISSIPSTDIRLFESSTIEVQGNAEAGFAISLRPLADGGVGAALWKFTRDSFGRVSGTQSATTDDLAEGAANLYHTTERAQDATGAAITAGTGDGVTLAYDDAGNKINATNTDKGSVAVASHVAASDPHPQYAMASSVVGPVPTRIAAGQTYTVPADTQALWTLPIELEAGASIEALGDLVEVN